MDLTSGKGKRDTLIKSQPKYVKIMDDDGSVGQPLPI